MDQELRESYRILEKRLFHEGRIVTPSFNAKNNMFPFFQAIGLKPFLTINKPICPIFVVEFYHSLEVKRYEEDIPYIEFKLEHQAQLLRDLNKLYIDDIHPDLKGWELFFKETFFCSIDKRNKEVIKKCKGLMSFAMLLTRLYNNILDTNPQSSVPIARFTFNEHVIDPLDILRNPITEKGKKIASPPVISSSSSSSDDNEAPFFLEFYDQAIDIED
ncbi:hypothetical protein Tco_0895041 [Tanacetum coccineum]|uniref:Uncharacterized protein n=1 Tax=Tanacetum coccineum TaxID=301880 RepID=A0ABQ5CJR3_9ASTR